MRLDALKSGHNPPEDINVIIEVPVGGGPPSSMKWIRLRARCSSTASSIRRCVTREIPGFVPHTLSADGDPIDVLVCNTRAIIPGGVINCRPVGVLVMEDDGGGDEKIIAVPSTKLTKRYDNVKTYTDLPKISIEQIELLCALQRSRARQMGQDRSLGPR